jgi:hypothetical protein
MLLCFSANAEIYKWVDENGKIHYSDKEVTGAEQVKLPKTITIPATATGSNSDSSDQDEDGKAPYYTKMAIIKPEMNETIRNRGGGLDIVIDLTPELRGEDTISLYMDGNTALKNQTQTSISLPNIERGSHTLRASVFNKEGDLLISSKSIIFHIRKEVVKEQEKGTTDNSEAFKPKFNKSQSEQADYNKSYDKDYSDNFSKDYGSNNDYNKKANEFNKGVSPNSGTFSSGSNYKPNYNQK